MGKKLSIVRWVTVAVVAVTAAVAVNGVTNANTVPTSRLGDGSGAISGYTVTNVAYTWDAADPTLVDAVTFTLSAAASHAQVELVNGSGTWYACTNTANNDWSCDTTSPQATSAAPDNLRVVAKSA